MALGFAEDGCGSVYAEGSEGEGKHTQSRSGEGEEAQQWRLLST